METQLTLSGSYEEKKNEYRRNSHSVGISIWHFEWCTKYRYKMFLKEDSLSLVTACIRRAASMHRIRIVILTVMAEHVHCEAEIPLTMSPSQAMQLLKGISARLFFINKVRTRLRYPKGHLWSRGKFASSVGFVQVDVVTEYIKNQKEHHLGNRTL